MAGKKLYLVGRSLCNDQLTCNMLDMILLQKKLGITGQTIHLLQDGVTAAKKNGLFHDQMQKIINAGVTVTVQEEDLLARGDFPLIKGISKVNYSGTIDLIFQNEGICSNI